MYNTSSAFNTPFKYAPLISTWCNSSFNRFAIAMMARDDASLATGA
jgi:hypothetical protein